MTLKIKRFDTSFPLPQYQTAGSVALDLSSRSEVVIPAQSVARVPLNIAIQLPEGHWAMLSARSSLHKKGLMLANGVGVGDADFCGDSDEYQAALFNFTQTDVVLPPGERIVQLLILPYAKPELVEVEHLGNADRGGFGSTGA
jgi:dUTP pyrophosphatase